LRTALGVAPRIIREHGELLEWPVQALSPQLLRGNRVSGSYHVGLQQGGIDSRLEGEGRVGFSFAGMDEMDEVHGRGEFQIEGAQVHFVLAYYQGGTFTSICERLGD
jgi:hypothetical protein